MATDDLAKLASLDESTLLLQLERRFKDNEIYTYIGDILISINPLQCLNIYDEKLSSIYCGNKLKEHNKPHIYAVANEALQNLGLSRKSQSCIVSGESGSGKTENIKFLLQKLVVHCTKPHPAKEQDDMNLHNALIELNPLMEAFGNARTVINENSSRFCKYIELSFNEENFISGGQISIFLLEKTRVTGCHKDESNFHVFYYLLAGLTSSQKSRYLLGNPENHRVFRQYGGTTKAQMIHSKMMFGQLQKSLKHVDFSQEDVDAIYAYLAAIIHLADIEFGMDHETDGVYITNETPLYSAADLIGVSPENLVIALISNVNIIRGEKVSNLKNLAQAEDGRDALAKALYSKLFNWILCKINIKLKRGGQTHRSERPPVIGLLDIAGFENLSTNAFEQLCINVANEQLQYIFNQHVFAWEKKDLENEGVNTRFIEFNNNASILQMFVEKPLGFFALLDEESNFPKATSSSFLEKLKKHLPKCPHFKKEKGKDMFSVNHYAGTVVYTSCSILERNRDTLSANLLDCLMNSQSKIIADLFSWKVEANESKSNAEENVRTAKTGKAQHLLRKDQSLSKSAGKRIKQEMQNNKKVHDRPEMRHKTAGSQFLASLSSLTNTLLNSQPHFIRCIKPNNSKMAGIFDTALVRQQLRYAGILETIRIRHEGFPVRLEFSTFLQRYRFIRYSLTAPLEVNAENCRAVLTYAGLHQWELGTNKVFLKYWHSEHLNITLQKAVQLVIIVQKIVRGFLARKLASQQRKKILKKNKAMVSEFLLTIANISQKTLDLMSLCQTEDRRRHAEKVFKSKHVKMESSEKLDLTPKKGMESPALLILKESEKHIVNGLEKRMKVFKEISNNEEKPWRNPETCERKDAALRKNTWRKQHEKQKDHVTNIKNMFETRAAVEKDCQKMPNFKTKNSPQKNQAPASDTPSKVIHQMFSPPSTRRLQHRKQPLQNGTPKGPYSGMYNSHENLLEKDDNSHYARQSSRTQIKILKSQHYLSLIQEALHTDLPKLPETYWAKMVYMETSFRCQTLLANESEIRIDGAAQPDPTSHHIAINSIENPFRDDRTAKIREHIGKGVRITLGKDGSIWALRLSLNNITVCDYHDPNLTCASSDIIKLKGTLPKDQPVKIFDMGEFRSHIILEIHKHGLKKLDLTSIYRRCCIVSLVFVRGAQDDMANPCWINIINLTALRLLQNEHTLKDLENEMQKIMRSNIDLRRISQLPGFVKVHKAKESLDLEEVRALSALSDPYSSAPRPENKKLDRGSKIAEEFRFKKFNG